MKAVLAIILATGVIATLAPEAPVTPKLAGWVWENRDCPLSGFCPEEPRETTAEIKRKTLG